jgi:arylsulfatase A-like enzyme
MPRARALILLLLLAACGQPSDPSAGGRLLRPQLALAADARPLPQTRLAARLEVPVDVAPWRVVCEDFSVSEEPGGARVLDLRGGALIELPGPFEPGAFQQLAVVGLFPAVHNLNLGVHLDGREPLTSLRTVQADPLEQTLVFDLPELRRAAAPVSKLQLALRGPGFRLRAVELRHVPAVRSLPAPDAPRLVEIAGLARSAVGLAAGSPLEARFTPRAGERLEFSCGQPELLRAAGEGSRLRLTLCLPTGQEIRREIALEADLATPSAWHELRVPLAELAGREVSARFELLPADSNAATCALANLLVVGPAEDPPTVLLVTSDTHRGDYLAVSGSGVDVATPCLDALAARGVLFEDCFAATNNTSPSHVAILTGLPPRDTGLVNNHDRISEAVLTLAEIFGERGWATHAAVSAHHLGPHGTGLGQGFERMAGPGATPWDAGDAVDRLLEWLPAAADRPLFAWLHVFDAHTPYAPPEPFDRAYDSAGRDPFDPALGGRALGPDEAPAELVGLRDLSWPETQYRGEVSYLDRELGRLLAAPRLADALVAFTADHGEVFAKKGVHFAHAGLYPDTLHVPLILAGPGVPRGERVARPVGNIDLGRTLLDLAGLEQVAFPGRDLLDADAVPGPGDGPRFALSANGRSAVVAYRQWFLRLHLRTSAAPNTEVHAPHTLELFDRSSDPECLNDVAGEQAETARGLRRLLVEWLQEAPSADLTEETQLSAQALAELAALGYVADDGGGGASSAWIDPECGCEHCRAWR